MSHISKKNAVKIIYRPIVKIVICSIKERPVGLEFSTRSATRMTSRPITRSKKYQWEIIDKNPRFRPVEPVASL